MITRRSIMKIVPAAIIASLVGTKIVETTPAIASTATATELARNKKWLEENYDSDAPIEVPLCDEWTDEYGNVFRIQPYPSASAHYEYDFIVYPHEKTSQYLQYVPVFQRTSYSYQTVYEIGTDNLNDQIRHDMREFVSLFYQLEREKKIRPITPLDTALEFAYNGFSQSIQEKEVLVGNSR